MTYEECTNLLDAYEQVVLLMGNDAVMEWGDVSSRVCKAKDSLGEFICSMLSDSPISDRHATDGCEL